MEEGAGAGLRTDALYKWIGEIGTIMAFNLGVTNRITKLSLQAYKKKKNVEKGKIIANRKQIIVKNLKVWQVIFSDVESLLEINYTYSRCIFKSSFKIYLHDILRFLHLCS